MSREPQTQRVSSTVAPTFPSAPVEQVDGGSRQSAWQLFPRRLLQLPVHGYRLFFKAWLGNACRFEPTCSAYALTALERHGAWRGSLLTSRRLLRCHPWCEGGHDPVPPEARQSHKPLPPNVAARPKTAQPESL